MFLSDNSDNGTEFKNRVVEDFLKERGVHHTNTPTYHPQANPVERANRTLKTMVASYLKERHTTWDEKLPELLFAMNTAVHSSTGTSPLCCFTVGNLSLQVRSVGCKRLRQKSRLKKKVWLDGKNGSTPFQAFTKTLPRKREQLKPARPAITTPAGATQTLSQAFAALDRYHTLHPEPNPAVTSWRTRVAMKREAVAHMDDWLVERRQRLQREREEADRQARARAEAKYAEARRRRLDEEQSIQSARVTLLIRPERASCDAAQSAPGLAYARPGSAPEPLTIRRDRRDPLRPRPFGVSYLPVG